MPLGLCTRNNIVQSNIMQLYAIEPELTMSGTAAQGR